MYRNEKESLTARLKELEAKKETLAAHCDELGVTVEVLEEQLAIAKRMRWRGVLVGVLAMGLSAAIIIPVCQAKVAMRDAGFARLLELKERHQTAKEADRQRKWKERRRKVQDQRKVVRDPNLDRVYGAIRKLDATDPEGALLILSGMACAAGDGTQAVRLRGSLSAVAREQWHLLCGGQL